MIMTTDMSTMTPSSLERQLRWRYATKEFDSAKDIDAETWQALQNSLVLSPSSFGLQPWHFSVVEDPAVLEELVTHSWGQTQPKDCSKFIVFAARQQTTLEDIDDFISLTAETRGSSVESLGAYRDVMASFVERMTPGEQLEWAKKQTYIALGQLMTAAAVLGVDTCPMEGIVPVQYDRLLGYAGKGFTTSVACALGYRSADDRYASAEKVRDSAEKLISVV